MPAPYDAKAGRVRVSTTEAGTYNVVGYVRSADLTHGSEGDTTIYWLGGEQSKAGNQTLTGSLPVYFDREDTNGQAILRTAWKNGTSVWLQIAPEGVGASAKVDQFRCVITEFTTSYAADGEAVEGGFSFRGDASTLTTVTLGS